MSSPPMAETPASSFPQSSSDSRDVARWQRKLLPYMTRFLVVMAIGFFAFSLYDMYAMRAFIKNETSGSIRSRIEEIVRPSTSPQSSSSAFDVVQKSLLLLEADAMDKRYRQASALLMSRIWTRQLTFMTGMVLAFIGAVFILGKLSEAKSDVSLGAEHWKGAISSSSPGLILAFFGTALIATSLIVQPRIEVQDRSVYFGKMGLVKIPANQAAKQDVTSKTDAGPINPGLSTPADAPD